MEFDLDTFENHFKKLVAKNTLENPKIMTSKNFIHDACTTACMMYEEDIKLFYIDRGFQEFLFAQHYFLANPEELEDLGHMLWNVAETDFNGNEAFEMLKEFSSEKFDRYFLKPYLQNIFNGKSEIVEFVSFLRYGYREFEYQVIDTDMVAICTFKNNSEWVPLRPIITEPSSIIFSILLQQLEISNLLSLAVFEKALDYPEFMTAGIFGEHYFDSQNGKTKIIPRRLLRQDTNDLQSYERTHTVENYVRDNDQNLVCFGHEYKVDFDKVLEAPETYIDLINILKSPEEDVWKSYCKVKGYYEELTEKFGD